MPIRDRLRNQQFESDLFNSRAIIAGLIVTALVSVLFFRLYYLQYLSYGHYKTLSENNRVRLTSVAPTRGIIFDRNGEILAENLPTYQLELVPELIKDIDTTIQELRGIIEISDGEIRRFKRALRRERRFEGIAIKYKLNDEQVAKFAVNQHRFPGVNIEARLSRHYPYKDMAVHTIGYVGRINERELKKIDQADYAGTSHIGKTGIERYYEDRLHGKVGHRQVEVNVEGRVLRILDEEPATPGQNLYLTLDAKLQQVAEKAMQNYSGSVIAIDPNNGEVLAMVSKPGYDPNLFVNGISTRDYRQLNQNTERPLFNRSITGQYPPGSTVKPLVGLAGLENNITTAGHKVDCKGFYMLPNEERKYRDWKKTGHGLVNLDDAVAESCDVYFYDLAYRLSIDRIAPMLERYGFGQRTGIDNIGEARGILPSRAWKRKTRRQPWYPGETLIVGIGQGYMTATPIQLAKATALFATKGKLVKPHLLKKAKQDTQNIEESYPTGPYQYINPGSEKNWRTVNRSMYSVVHSHKGTAKQIGINSSYKFAGKTGTAQVYSIAQDEEYDAENTEYKLRDHALFIAYAPIRDPQIVVVVVAEHGGSGSSVAAPIAKKVLDHYLLKTLNGKKLK